MKILDFDIRRKDKSRGFKLNKYFNLELKNNHFIIGLSQIKQLE